MFSVKDKAKCVLLMAELKSVILVQRAFRREFGRDPPHKNNITRWFKQFEETGSVQKRKSTGRPSVPDETVELIRQSAIRSPGKSIPRRSVELGIPKTTVHKVLHKKLKLHAYKIQILQELQPNDGVNRYNFAVKMLDRISENESFLDDIIFTDEATFHVSGCVNRHNSRIWGFENPHVIVEKQRDSPKVNVWCGVMKNRVIGPFFFAEKTINGVVYLDMLINYCFPQLDELENIHQLHFQQDGAPPHFSALVTDALNEKFGDRWIGRQGPMLWPPRSPDLTPCDFFLWGYIKNIVFSQKIRDLNHLKNRINEAMTTITEEMLANVWREVDYRLDICRATKGAHIEIY